jgi:ectoine hydroxylase-related dioxygenase (phytanoyl-CoA dioxygenase family)
MRPFLDSGDAVRNPAELRARAERDGYLFLRGILPREPVLELRRQILEVCDRHGFVGEGEPLDRGIAAPGVRCREGDPEYMAAYDDIQRLEAFHALAHQPPLLEALEALFGEPVLVHPRNIARVMFPQNNRFTTPAHQDFVHVQGTENTWTAWIPVGDCPAELGGVEVLAGSHRFGVLPARRAEGAGGLGVDTEELGLSWHGEDFRCGDALLFHSLCVHRGRDNHTPDRLRLSVDYRYQGVSQPVEWRSLLPHFNRMPWDDIYRGWQRPELQYYWQQLDLKMVDFTPRYHEAAGRQVQAGRPAY